MTRIAGAAVVVVLVVVGMIVTLPLWGVLIVAGSSFFLPALIVLAFVIVGAVVSGISRVVSEDRHRSEKVLRDAADAKRRRDEVVNKREELMRKTVVWQQKQDAKAAAERAASAEN